ncbi:MAG TPA: hypothetical protein VEK12_15095 [Alphaproteobacteria bacterium]|nr:hypothetical protein [Alphaproteobacteria bacterium]
MAGAEATQAWPHFAPEYRIMYIMENTQAMSLRHKKARKLLHLKRAEGTLARLDERQLSFEFMKES